MLEFKRDKATGIVYAYRDGKKAGPVNTMGDNVNGENLPEDKDGDTGAGRDEHHDQE